MKGLGALIGLALLALSMIPGAYAALDCQVNPSSGTWAQVFRVSATVNAHAQTLAGTPPYPFTVECRDTSGSALQTTCTNPQSAELFWLSTPTNAHAEIPTILGGPNPQKYSNEVCLGPSDGISVLNTAMLGNGQDCSIIDPANPWTCIATLSNTTNAHMTTCNASTPYPYTVCASLDASGASGPPKNIFVIDYAQAFPSPAECSASGTLVSITGTFTTIQYAAVTSVQPTTLTLNVWKKDNPQPILFTKTLANVAADKASNPFTFNITQAEFLNAFGTDCATQSGEYEYSVEVDPAQFTWTGGAGVQTENIVTDNLLITPWTIYPPITCPCTPPDDVCPSAGVCACDGSICTPPGIAAGSDVFVLTTLNIEPNPPKQGDDIQIAIRFDNLKLSINKNATIELEIKDLEGKTIDALVAGSITASAGSPTNNLFFTPMDPAKLEVHKTYTVFARIQAGNVKATGDQAEQVLGNNNGTTSFTFLPGNTVAIPETHPLLSLLTALAALILVFARSKKGSRHEAQ